MGCYARESPSSVLSPSLLDVDFPDLLPVCSACKRSASPPPASSPSDDTSLRVTKRRRKSRAKPKAPVTQIPATKLSFKGIVHQFTGNHNPVNLPAANPAKPSSPRQNYVLQPAVGAQYTASGVLLAKLAYSLRVLNTICAHVLQDGSSSRMETETLSVLRALAKEAKASGAFFPSREKSM